MLEFLGNIILPSNLSILFLIVGVILVINEKEGGPVDYVRPVCDHLRHFWNGDHIHLALGTLENRYTSLASTEGLQDVKCIVILAGYAERHEELPLSSEVNFASAYRLMEGLRIVHLLPGSRS
jgi:hypothetical protein